ncbi:MAG TPA: thioredoxin family protein [Thermoanaerobaculia bacterium]|nr:thioredoxin family protein [Thermoanaerobaculia bacterium]
MRLLTALFLSVFSLQPRQWNDSIRDVFVDGKLDRTAQTLTTSDSPRVFAVLCGDDVLLLDPAANTIARAPRSNFEVAADKLTAKSGAIETTSTGNVMHPNDDTYVATIEGKNVVISSHQSHAGPMTLDELWTTAPVWRAVADTYEPDAATIERLRAIHEPVRLQIVMATWCGDSRKHVPRLLKAVERANNPNLSVELIGIGPDFTTPMDLIVREDITNVPTVLVQRNGAEVGRFVETPAGATIESDIADIVNGTPKPHPGRYERGAQITSGAYELRRGRRIVGNETFELYERKEGGVIAHSVIANRDGTSTETWAAADAAQKPLFAEVTHRVHGVATRTRFRRDGDGWGAVSRGARSGIAEQSLTMPEALVTPASVTFAWASGARTAFFAPEEGLGATRAVDFKIRMRGRVPERVECADGTQRILR